jgi:riboflavin kinase/FMN adenylyltransferase
VRVFRHLADLSPDRFRTPVVTLGVFDGIHRGHRELLARARALADGLSGELVVVTFHVHPRQLTEGRSPPMLTSVEHRVVLLGRLGVDATVVLRFDDALRTMSAERFVEEILVARIGVRGAVLGYDSHFGHNREGDVALLERLLVPRGIPVERTEPVRLDDGEIVSSSAIRDAVARSDLTRDAELLGRAPALFGVVVRGDGRGRGLGFATANLDLEGELRPPRGVYAGRVEIDGRRHMAAVNIGGRPTFYPEGGAADTVEVHVLDFDGALYGQRLEVILLGRVRDERSFDSVDALRAQIAADVADIRSRWGSVEGSGAD